MDGEFNNLSYDNTNITFSVATDNIATSDELSADPIYQRQMGTNYSKGKKVGKAVTIVGISIAFTATAIATGSTLANIFVPKPPTISNQSYVVEDGSLKYSFKVDNPKSYKTTYYVELDETIVLNDSCQESKEYCIVYSPVVSGQKCRFYINFTNSLDYHKTIYTNEFII